jgi:hypothetical protein
MAAGSGPDATLPAATIDTDQPPLPSGDFQCDCA